MKKLVTIFSLALCFMLISSAASAQTNYNYRNGSSGISVAVDQNGNVYSIAYLDNNGNWQEGKITEQLPDDEGISYVYQDVQGTYFSLYYSPQIDQVFLTRLTDDAQITLSRQY